MRAQLHSLCHDSLDDVRRMLNSENKKLKAQLQEQKAATCQVEQELEAAKQAVHEQQARVLDMQMEMQRVTSNVSVELGEAVKEKSQVCGLLLLSRLSSVLH